MLDISDNQILDAYKVYGNCHVVGKILGVSHSLVHRCLIKHNVARKNPKFTDLEKQFLIDNYDSYAESGNLSSLAAKMGRTKHFLCRKAKELCLTKKNRPDLPHVCLARAEGRKRAYEAGLHPRGMLGKKHSPEAREKFSEAQKKRWGRMTDNERASLTLLQLQNKLEKYGNLAPNVKRGSWRAGWREFGGRRHFFRSRWESNYARYLEWLKINKKIADWEYEPKTFWFDAIKRGVRSYKPDFLVTENDGTYCWHEVKGWMDDRSKTTLKRMAKYYPLEKILVIDKKQYRSIESKMSRILSDWEGTQI